MKRRILTAATAAVVALATPAVASADTHTINANDLAQLSSLSSMSSLPQLPQLPSGDIAKEIENALNNRSGNQADNTTPAPKPAPKQESSDAQVAAQVIAQVNEYRASKGKSTLAVDESLSAGAQQWAKTMKVNQDFRHPDTVSFRENIAFNHGGAAKAVEQWNNSPGHNTNMLADDVKTIGAGVVRGPLRTTDANGKVIDYGEGTFFVLRLR